MRSECEGVEEAVWRREEQSRREQLVERFEERLEAEPELRGIFRCLCAGLKESKAIARRLGLDERAVVNGRKKLIRRAGEFERKRERPRWRLKS
jgi:FixJ family two-component response regulator